MFRQGSRQHLGLHGIDKDNDQVARDTAAATYHILEACGMISGEMKMMDIKYSCVRPMGILARIHVDMSLIGQGYTHA